MTLKIENLTVVQTVDGEESAVSSAYIVKAIESKEALIERNTDDVKELKTQLKEVIKLEKEITKEKKAIADAEAKEAEKERMASEPVEKESK